jgi:hypothetical protein
VLRRRWSWMSSRFEGAYQLAAMIRHLRAR